MQNNSTLSPSAVRVSLPIKLFNSAWLLMNSSRMRMYFESTSPLGLMWITPSVPSTMAVSLSLTVLVMPGTDNTAGISRALASIAEWDVFPPTSVMIPETFSLTIWLVMEGVRSFATRTVPGSTLLISMSLIPRRIFKRLVLMSLISEALCFMVSSSIFENIPMNMSQTALTAASAHCPASIIFFISPDIVGSEIITR